MPLNLKDDISIHQKWKQHITGCNPAIFYKYFYNIKCRNVLADHISLYIYIIFFLTLTRENQINNNDIDIDISYIILLYWHWQAHKKIWACEDIFKLVFNLRNDAAMRIKKNLVLCLSSLLSDVRTSLSSQKHQLVIILYYSRHYIFFWNANISDRKNFRQK